MSNAHLRLVILAVDDVARAAAFYRSVFDWTVVVDLPIYVELELSPEIGVSLYQRESFAVNTGIAPQHCTEGAITSTELYLRVDDLDATIGRLHAAGARELAPAAPRDWGDTAAYFADPDGNVLAVAVHTHDATD